MEKTSLRGIKFDLMLDTVKRFIREYGNERKFVIGLSGGLDSSVTAWLASMAVGKESVLGLIMPDGDSTPSNDINDARKISDILGINVNLINIDQIIGAYKAKLNPDTRSLGNLKARIRMSILYFYANSKNLLVLGTGDKSEIYLGYYTKYGDGGVDLLPIGDIYKTELREFAYYLGLPESIIKKRSSPRLWQGQLAEDELGVSYEFADRILFRLLEKNDNEKIIINEEGEMAKKVLELYRNSEHKRKMPPIALLQK
jgi:NAD+ synthase